MALLLNLASLRRNPSTLSLAEERRYQQRINAQSNIINNQIGLVKKLQSDFRITPNEVKPFITATNKRLEAQWERQRLQTERAINRQSNPVVAARLQAQSARAAESRRRSILANTARGR